MKTMDLKPAASQLTRYAYLILCGALAYFLSNYFFSVLFERDSWNLADWLISYESGFVRRGLVGELIIELGDLLSINIKWISFAAQSATWISIYYLTIKIYSLRSREKEWLLFLLSPAFLLFPFFDMGAGLRKEILLFLSFAILAYAYAQQQISRLNVLLCYVFFVLATFSHELATLATTFFVFIFYRSYQLKLLTKQQAALYSAVFILTAFIAGIFAILFHGDQTLAKETCLSLTSRGLDQHVCSGAIRWLGYSSKETLSIIFEIISGRKPRYFIDYPITILITIAPLLLLKPQSRDNIYFLILAFICFLPLYVIAIDWYRWIYVYASLSFLFILSDSVISKVNLKRVNGWVIFLYLTLWSVHSTSGWFSFFNYLITEPDKVFSL